MPDSSTTYIHVRYTIHIYIYIAIYQSQLCSGRGYILLALDCFSGFFRPMASITVNVGVGINRVAAVLFFLGLFSCI